VKLATIELIKSVEKHPNADSLSLCSVLGFRAITKLNQFKVGDKIVFIQPDCVLPANEKWAEFYRAKSNRTKAIRLRGVWSEGIIESLSNLELSEGFEVGAEVSELLGVTHYQPPIPKELNAKCSLRFGLTKTDEERFNNLESIPYGEEVIVTLKIDGSSASYGCKLNDNNTDEFITSRSLELKPECINNYTLIEKKYDILNKLETFCQTKLGSFCLRGEIYGIGVQSFANNPHSKLPLDFAAFNLLNLDTMQYESFTNCIKFCGEFGIPYVPILETAILTPELIKKYSEDLTEINGKPFEGVVIKLANGQSFKVINKNYDSKK
jgi:RNA ligase (TIGR02306 family)